MKLSVLLKENTGLLKAAGVPDAAYDARQLLLSAYGLTAEEYLLAKDREAEDPAGAERFETMVRRRAQREPLQYILGEAWFMGRRFLVTPEVLIPRPDTETLVELVLLETEAAEKHSVLDLCTGSGCIAVSLAGSGHFAEVAAADISPEALRIALRNAKENGTPVRFFQSNLFEAVTGRYDILVSNPPYIRKKDLTGLEPEVGVYEPKLALDGGEDGLEFYRRIVAQAGRCLTPGGSIYLETGFDQAEAAAELLAAHGFHRIRVTKDLAGLDRVVSGYEYTGTN